MKYTGAIAARDMLLDEPREDVAAATVRRLRREGWSIEQLLAELPFLGEGRVRACLGHIASTS